MFGDREKYLELTGAEGYIAKPIHDPAALIEAVRASSGPDHGHETTAPGLFPAADRV